MWAVLALVILNLPNVIHQNPVRFLSGNVALGRYLLLAILIPNIVTSGKAFDFTVRALIAVATAVAIIGIVQFLASYLLGINVTLIDPPDSAFKPTPIGMVMRASALAITAQHYSGFLTLTLPFLLFAVTDSRGQVAPSAHHLPRPDPRRHPGQLELRRLLCRSRYLHSLSVFALAALVYSDRSILSLECRLCLFHGPARSDL